MKHQTQISFITTVVFVIAGTLLIAQTKQHKHTISGSIIQKGSKELIPGASIYFPELKTGVNSNSYGFYSIEVPEGEYQMQIQFVGFNTITQTVKVDKNLTINPEITEGIALKEVEVVSSANEKVSENTQMGTINIPITQIKNVPAIGGEKDVMKVLQLLPGVQKGNEGASGLFVRGGGNDQNLIILDDAPVYNAYHLFGFMSVFNSDALKNVELIKGAFPARYGGRLSSVLDMTMKDGNKEKLKGETTIGLITSKALIEGPIKKEKSSFLISGRRTYVDVLVSPFQDKNNKYSYYFYDANAKLNFILGKKDRLFVSGYFGKDKFNGYQNEDKDWNRSWGKQIIEWENATATVRWNHIINSKLFSNTSAIFSHYNINISDISNIDRDEHETTFSNGMSITTPAVHIKYFTLFSSSINDITLKNDFDYFPNNKHHLKFGVGATNHLVNSFSYTVTRKLSDEKSGVESPKPITRKDTYIYAEDDWSITKNIKTNAGIRCVGFMGNGKGYYNIEPRTAIRYLFKNNFAIKGSYSVMNQFLHQLSTTSIGLPTEMWVFANNKIRPQHSTQYSLGLAKDIIKHGLTFTMEAYYKKSKNVINYKNGASFYTTASTDHLISWEDNVTQGQSESYGLEFFAHKKEGRFNGWISYTLSWSYLQFDELNDGKKFFSRQDRRHDLSLVGMYKLNDRISLAATWVYATANPFTLMLAQIPSNPDHASTVVENQTESTSSGSIAGVATLMDEYTSINGFRGKSYHRLDLSIQFHKKKQKTERALEISIYNAYNRQNPFYYKYGYVEGKMDMKIMQVTLFPIIPSISYTIKF